MTMLDFIANLAYLCVDVIAIFSVVGSAIYLIGAVVARLRHRRFRPTEQVLTWSVGGLLLGTTGLACLVLSDYSPKSTFFFEYSWTTVGAMLGGSLLLLVVSWMLPARLIRRTR
jgi:hypothetical protein